MNDEQKAAPTADEIYRLVKENNHMLKAMRRSAFIGGILKILFWVLILFVIPYITYVVYLKPLIDQITPVAAQMQQNAETINATVSGFPDIAKFFEQFMGGSAEEN